METSAQANEQSRKTGQSSKKPKTDVIVKQVEELKAFIHAELQRGSEIAEVASQFDAKAEKIIAEFRDYQQLEHRIDDKTEKAVRAVDTRIGLVALVIGVLTFFGWNYLVDRASKTAIARVGEAEAKAEINCVVSNHVHSTMMRKIEECVPQMIRKRVPAMIETSVRDTRGKAEDANAHIKQVEEKVDVMSVVFSARAGSRADYDNLRAIAKGTNHVARLAFDAVKEIVNQYKERKYRFDAYRPTLTRNGRKIEIETLVELAHADLDWNCDGAVCELTGTKRKEFVATLIEVVKQSKRIVTVYLAIRGIESLTNKSFDPIDIDQVLAWWKDEDRNPEYHSPYELYYDMTCKVRRGALSESNCAKVDELIREAKSLIDKDPKCHIASKIIVYLITYYPDYKRKYDDGRKELCGSALKDLVGTPFQDANWYVYNSYYSFFFDATNFCNNVNQRLKEDPGFEKELQLSGLFTTNLFARSDIQWPSKQPKPSAKPVGSPDVISFPLSQMSVVLYGDQPSGQGANSGNGVGYVSAEIKKGRRELREIPRVKARTVALQKLGDIKNGVATGDSITWEYGGVSRRFTFDGKHWNDAKGDVAEDVEIPSGLTPVIYERMNDVTTSVSFAVEF